MTLGDMGAEVVKVEPLDGEDARTLPPFVNGESAFFASVNRNKRGVALDFRRPEGLAVLDRLVANADVVIHNFPPPVRDRLGLSYERLRAVRDDVIVCSVSAFGERGPARDKIGLDLVFQAMGGIMSVTGEPNGPPLKAGVPLADVTAGLLVAHGATLALFARDRGHGGQHVRVALIDGVLTLQSVLAPIYLCSGQDPSRLGNDSPFTAPNAVFDTADGGRVAIAVPSDRIFARFAAAIDRPELAADARFTDNAGRVAHRQALATELEEVFAARPLAAWVELLETAGVPAGPVRNYGEVFTDPQVDANDMLVEIDHPIAGRMVTVGMPIKLDATPGQIRRPPPTLGQHTEEVLAEAGVRPDEIGRLRLAALIR